MQVRDITCDIAEAYDGAREELDLDGPLLVLAAPDEGTAGYSELVTLGDSWYYDEKEHRVLIAIDDETEASQAGSSIDATGVDFTTAVAFVLDPVIFVIASPDDIERPVTSIKAWEFAVKELETSSGVVVDGVALT